MEFLCLDFLNSYWRDWRGSGRHEDRVDNPNWRREFVTKWGLIAPEDLDSPDEKTLQALKELRGKLQEIVEALTHEAPLGQENLEALNRVLQQIPSYSQVELTQQGLGIKQVFLTDGWPLLIGKIAYSFAELVTNYDLRRIKICANEDCRWIFYDESRNRAKHWCDTRYCGNLLKVRRFRARQKEKDSD